MDHAKRNGDSSVSKRVWLIAQSSILAVLVGLIAVEIYVPNFSTYVSQAYVEAQKWQTALGACLGFIGVIVAGSWNARHARSRDKEQRAEEVKALCIALYGEIQHIRPLLSRATGTLARIHLTRRFGGRMYVNRDDPYGEEFQERAMLPETPLFSALQAKLGMLPLNVVGPITAFYSEYAEVKAWLPLLAGRKDRRESVAISHVLEPAVRAIDDVRPGLRAIEKLAMLPRPDKEPNTTKHWEAIEDIEKYTEILPDPGRADYRPPNRSHGDN
jgi:hypothetical protein